MDRKQEIFEHMPIPKAVATLAIPTVIGLMISTIYNLADTFFVGQTNNPAAVAAVTLSYPAFVAIAAVSNLFGIGGASMIARSLGKQRPDLARRTAAFCFYTAIAVTALYSLLTLIFRESFASILGADSETYAYTYDYLKWVLIVGGIPTMLNLLLAHLVRSEAGAKQASIGISLGGLLNIGLDPLFMFVLLPPGKEVAGAAIATMLSNVIASLYFLVYLYKNRRTSVISLHIHNYKFDREIIRNVTMVGLPAALQTALVVVSNTVLNQLTKVSAQAINEATSAAAIAAVGIAKKIDMIPMNVTMGIAQGVLPLLGYNYAAGNHERMHGVERFAIITAVLFSFACVALFEPLAVQIVGLFIHDAQTLDYAASFLRRLCVATPFMAVCFMITSMFQATGQSKQVLLLSVYRKGVADIPVMYLMNYLVPLYGLLWTQTVVDITAVVIAFTLYAHFKKRLRQEAARPAVLY